MRERELLVADPDPDDRRNMRLRPSDAGRAVHAQGHVLNTRAVEGLDAREQAQLADLLRRVKANLRPGVSRARPVERNTPAS